MRVAGSLWSVPVDQRSSRLAAAAGLTAAHWDATDGQFAAAGGFTADAAAELQAGCPGLSAEAHLMMRDPRAVVPSWAEFCSLIVVHLEAEQARAAVAAVAATGAQPGLAVSLHTRLSLVPADFPVLLMSIAPGQAGSAFDSSVLARVSQLRERGRNPLIGVDGGVGRRHFAELAAAGANWVVSGTDLFAAADASEWVAGCRAAFTERSDPVALQ